MDYSPSFPTVMHFNCVINASNLLQDLVGALPLGPATCLLMRVAVPAQPPTPCGERSYRTMLSAASAPSPDSHRQGPSLSPFGLVWLGLGLSAKGFFYPSIRISVEDNFR